MDWYEIFTNETGQGVSINKAIVYGTVATVSTAVLVPALIGTANGVSNLLVPDRDPAHVLSVASVLPTSSRPGPIEIYFSTPVFLPAGSPLAFGFVVPMSTTVDATLFGTDTLPSGLSSTDPTYFTGLYFTDSLGQLALGNGNHYLVAESAPLEIQQVISFFDSSVQNGTLIGNGPGNSAQGRLGALRNMLAAAANLIASHDNSDAVTQLQEAYLRTDGNSQPPDFVMGQATDALAGRILELIHLLGG
ncbi:MAG: hypothetical protein DMF89_10910 [Acidobacteria bacterium]|nr:MAG: hypothetical protein DMF89_10910 [Acidobacteriota bacterium]